MNPQQARAARAMLGLDMKSVCTLADVGKRTLTEFEAGMRSINAVTAGKLEAFYITRGIVFEDGGDRIGVALRTISLAELQAADRPGAKVEYRDVFRVHESSALIGDLERTLSALESLLNFSQATMVETLAARRTNQKALAAEMGVSLAFVNAIVTGKKKLPLEHLSFIEKTLTRNGRVATALRTERALQRQLKEVQKQIEALSQGLLALKPGPS